VILIPLGVALALKMIPIVVVQECTVKAEDRIKNGKPKNWLVGSLIILVWIVIFLWISIAAYRHWFN